METTPRIAGCAADLGGGPMARNSVRWAGRQVETLLRAEPAAVEFWLKHWPVPVALLCMVTVVVGAGLYGATMGCWRSSLQAIYTAIKLPLVILLTTLGNGLLNGMLAPLLGVRLGFRQSLTAVLMSFAIAAVLLGSLSPLAGFVVWNTPPLSHATHLSSVEYGLLQLTHVVLIAAAGVCGNLKLVPFLVRWGGSLPAARRVLLAWLAVNLFLGSQICWVLRPFIWDPARPVEFIGPEYFRGSFYETVFNALRQLVIS